MQKSWWLFPAFILCFAFSLSAAENWPRFRGENGTGHVADRFPTEWSPGDYEWNVEITGIGHSSPVIWKDTLFVTSAIDEGSVRFLHAVDTKTGQLKWTRFFGLNRSHKHNKNSWASGSPATDGERVYVPFADRDMYSLSAYDFSGNLAWRKRLGSFQSQHGQGVSPIVVGDLVIIPNDQQGPSSIIALDKRTGTTVWSSLRSFRKTSYATPMLLTLRDEAPQLICVSGATGVTSLDPLTGRQNWQAGEFPMRTVASPIFANGLIYASCGGGGKGKLMIGVDPSLSAKNDARLKYERKTVLPYVPTPVAHEGLIFLWNDNGVVSCVRLADGENIWTKRAGGNYSGSPVCVGGNLYCMSEEGEVVVIAAAAEYRLLARIPLDDPSHATPAVAGNRMFLRSFHRLRSLPARF